jgi:hypothetical protein
MENVLQPITDRRLTLRRTKLGNDLITFRHEDRLPRLAKRIYSDNRALSCLMPTTFIG